MPGRSSEAEHLPETCPFCWSDIPGRMAATHLRRCDDFFAAFGMEPPVDPPTLS